MSYTPGPWSIEEQDGSPHLTIVDAKGRPVANVARGNRWMPWGEGSANAELIRSAPDLLEAAEAAEKALINAVCVRQCERLEPRPGCACAVSHVIGQLEAAIAKAKGGDERA